MYDVVNHDSDDSDEGDAAAEVVKVPFLGVSPILFLTQRLLEQSPYT